jgi:ectoine hydroxylase-related dioxygenase (phytanoyl-CoA dioxygenase family)
MEEIIKKLKDDGYCVLPNIYSKKEIKKLLALCLKWYEITAGEISAEVPFLNRDQPNIYNLQNKDFYFLKALFKPEIIETILIHFLNDTWFKQIPQEQPNYILRSFGARSNNKGLPLHIDSFIPYTGEYVLGMQYAIILEDQNQNNGCTVVIPGSHKSGQYAGQESLSKAIPIESKAGDIVIWDSRAWHGTTENNSGKTRWSIVSTFTRWWIKQHFNITKNLPPEIYHKLSEKQKAVLGFCSIPFNNEFEGIDLKRGYDKLPENPQQ